MRLILLVAISLALGGAALGAVPGAAALQCKTDIIFGHYSCTHYNTTVFELHPGCTSVLEPCDTTTPA